jgi:dihydrofolate synthase/folylpolyglutamate synthase
MTYSDAIESLHRLRPFGQVLGLELVQAVAGRLGHPERALRFLHIAGTNGKGSVAAMCHSVLAEAGYRTGLYTSPHLVSFTERFQINRAPCAPADIVRLWERVRPLREGLARELTLFETVTAMALEYFREQRADVVVWETGLGGRLDATNMVTPLVSVITTIGFDHMQYLGDTLEKIAGEKAGIIKPGVPVVTGVREPGPLAVIRERADRLGSPLTVVTEPAATAPLAGEHQRWNCAVAVAALRASGLRFTEEQLRVGLAQTHWPGRFQVIGDVVLDGAHNPAAAEVLVRTLGGERVDLIVGVLRDKDVRRVCEILAAVAREVVCVPVRSERTSDPRELAKFFPRATVAGSVAEALQRRRGDVRTLVTGSLFLVGEALALLQPGGVSAREMALQ